MRAKRNILIIVQNLPVPFDRRVWQEATSLRRHGFGVAVVCPKKGACNAGYERLEDVDIYRYPMIYEADKGVVGYFVEFVYCWLASLWLALKAYRHRTFHAIHARQFRAAVDKEIIVAGDRVIAVDGLQNGSVVAIDVVGLQVALFVGAAFGIRYGRLPVEHCGPFHRCERGISPGALKVGMTVARARDG